ncbi:MAG TPA: thiamine phosphate synthase [Sphingomonas sp.]
MTDERMGEALWPALEKLPRGAGVVFRHYGLAMAERRAVYERVRRISRRRHLTLFLAASPRQAAGWKADGVHGRSVQHSVRPLLRSAPVHDRRELVAARHADLRLVSPVFPTRSHVGARALGPVRLGLMLGRDRKAIVALGGMTHRRAQALRGLGITRWAAIDGLVPPEPVRT